MTTLQRPDDWEDPVVIPVATPPERILVPFDGSHNAERALAWACLIAEGTSAEVIVLVAFEQPTTLRGRGAVYVETVGEELNDEARELAEEAVARVAERGVRARGVVMRDDAARAILDTAEQDECDLIVMGRHGLTAELKRASSALDRFRELLAGGVSDKVARHASVPVLVVA